METPPEELSLEELRQRLRDAQARLPAHSIRPWQIAEIEDLEEEIARREADGDRED